MIRVFLVDDEIVIREGVRMSFPWEESGYTLVGEAPDGEMALPMIRDTRPDILITDIRMPFMDGMELCRVVRREMPWIGIIILSGYDEFEYARQGIQLGVREYMLKPVTAEELRSALDRVSESIRQEREERERSERLRSRMQMDQQFLKETLLGALYSEDTVPSDMQAAVEQLRGLGVNLKAACYAVIDAAFEPRREGYAALTELAECSGGAVQISPARTGGRALVMGDNEQDTEERAYAFAVSLRTEMERSGCSGIRLSIGEIVDAPEKIPQSLRSARHIRHVLSGQEDTGAVIVGVREFSEDSGVRAAAVMTAKARLYLADHFTDSSLMLQDVARAVGMSCSRFSTVFAQENGKTFTEYLTHLRLEKARELLRETDRKSSQIALDVGYNDGHYFSYIFRKNEGMTPGEYRNSHRRS